MQATDQPQPPPTPTPTQPCTGPGDRTEDTSGDGITRQSWHSCPTCHGSH